MIQSLWYDPGEIIEKDGHVSMRFGSYKKFLNESVGLNTLQQEKSYAKQIFEQNSAVAKKFIPDSWEEMVLKNDLLHLQKVQ